MNDERFLILGYVVVMYIIALLPIRRAFGIALLFVACSVYLILLVVKWKFEGGRK